MTQVRARRAQVKRSKWQSMILSHKGTSVCCLIRSVQQHKVEAFHFQQDNSRAHTADLMREWSAEQEVTFLKWPPNSSDLVMVPGIRFSPGAPCNPYNVSNPASTCILGGRQQRLFFVRISTQTPQTCQTLPIPLYHFGSLMLFWQSVWVPHRPALTTKKMKVADGGWKQA